MIEVVYSDKYLVVVIKPVGYISEDGDGSVPSLIREYLGDENAYVGVVHRLDKGVGGLMVYSLRPDVTPKLINEISSDGAGKEYVALLSGTPEKSEDTLTDLLYHDRAKNKTYAVKRKRNGVKEARLSYRVESIDETGRATVSVRLHTGRTHQIRAQFASRGLSLVGDARYGGCKGEISLYSRRLTFVHPITKKALTFESDKQFN